MRIKGIVQAVAGTNKLVAKEIMFDDQANAFVISVRPTKREQFRCSHCHQKAPYYDDDGKMIGIQVVDAPNADVPIAVDGEAVRVFFLDCENSTARITQLEISE